MDLRPLLYEWIASRANADANPATASLLGQLCSPSDGNAPPTTQELLSQLGNTNPAARIFAKYLADQQAKEPSAEGRSIREAEAELVQETLSDASRLDSDLLKSEEASRALSELSELRQQVETTFIELKQLRERNDALAWALGACCLCWGEDPDCRACRGRGRAGFSIPDRKWFGEYVVPAVRMLQVQKRCVDGFSANSSPQATR